MSLNRHVYMVMSLLAVISVALQLRRQSRMDLDQMVLYTERLEAYSERPR